MIIAIDNSEHSAYALEWTLDTSTNLGSQFSQMAEKQVMIVVVNDSEHNAYVLEWTLDHFFIPLGDSALFNLVIVHAKPFATTVVGLLLFLSNPDLVKIVEMETEVPLVATTSTAASSQERQYHSIFDLLDDFFDSWCLLSPSLLTSVFEPDN
ncbi:hypothetical protein SLEP1_g19827 [Rubroshorea leprosula]|uniref:Uncharacterized protein n=1 Tax=Rubroshorea leprosula TaxID=152421 RepID=A0AAV5J0K7_9ROSI|nr:hypothetical protein SLEP1_g19827 [Rubroshorea leprosula]